MRALLAYLVTSRQNIAHRAILRNCRASLVAAARGAHACVHVVALIQNKVRSALPRSIFKRIIIPHQVNRVRLVAAISAAVMARAGSVLALARPALVPGISTVYYVAVRYG